MIKNEKDFLKVSNECTESLPAAGMRKRATLSPIAAICRNPVRSPTCSRCVSSNGICAVVCYGMPLLSSLCCFKVKQVHRAGRTQPPSSRGLFLQ